MFQRLLIDRMEHRIIVGTLAFIGIMVLTGWIAINEGGRMQSFEQQFLARSIERGAGIFAASCSECHGLDGRGLTGIAPGLNNPALFGFDYLAEVNTQIGALQTELDAEGTTDERATELNAELTDLQNQHAQLLAQMQPAIDKGYDPDVPSRVAQVGWAGPQSAFIYTTLIHGRPTSISYWPRAMPAWSQLAGGPLRSDQLQDLVNYVENFDKGSNWTLEDLLAVNQFAKVPVEGSASGLPEGVEPAGDDVQAIVAQLDELQGDPVSGQQIYAQQGCAGCHEAGVIAPPTAATWTRIEEVRLQEPEFEGYTAVEYAVESIVQPNAYHVPGFTPVMPDYFDERLSVENIADLVAYIQSQDQPTE